MSISGKRILEGHELTILDNVSNLKKAIITVEMEGKFTKGQFKNYPKFLLVINYVNFDGTRYISGREDIIEHWFNKSLDIKKKEKLKNRIGSKNMYQLHAILFNLN